MTRYTFDIETYDIWETIPSYAEASRDPVPTYSLGRAADIPTTIYFCPRPLDFNLQYNMEPNLPLSRICHTVTHRGTFQDWETQRCERSVEATLGVLYKTLVGHYDNFRYHKREWGDCEAAIKIAGEDLSCRTFRDGSCTLKLVDEDTVKHLREIQKKMSKYGSKGCLIYTSSPTDNATSGILPLLRRWSRICSNKPSSTTSEIQIEGQDEEGRGRSLARASFYIKYTSDLDDVQKTRGEMKSLAASLNRSGFAWEKRDMELMARSKGFAIHNTPGKILDLLSSCESWKGETGRSREARRGRGSDGGADVTL